MNFISEFTLGTIMTRSDTLKVTINKDLVLNAKSLFWVFPQTVISDYSVWQAPVEGRKWFSFDLRNVMFDFPIL